MNINPVMLNIQELISEYNLFLNPNFGDRLLEYLKPILNGDI
jgi:hypothetical protein